jgi:hypothetical protein
VLFGSVAAVMAAVIFAAGSFPPALPLASSHADPSPTPSHAPAKKPPKIPCATPSTTGAVRSKGQTANTAGTKGGAWTGVLERVFVKTNTNGSVAGTPTQETVVSASGTSPVTVHIPVSGPVTAKLKHYGRGTPEANGQADVTLHPNGTAEQQVFTGFHHPLPVTVAVTYHLNGKAVSPSEIGGKSGTVQVTYKLTNTSSKPVSACFEGFNGQHQHITLSTPIPIIATVSLTVPKQATSFTAPGSSLSPSAPTVFVLWGASLFEPLGPLTQSFTFTMKTANATIPKASVVVDAVNPKTITGKAPATSAAALGSAEAAVSKGVSAIRTALGAVQQRVTALQKMTSSNDPPHAVGPSPDTAVKTDLATLGQSIAAALAKLGTLRTSLGTTRSASTGLSKAAAVADTLVTTISADAAEIAAAINELTSQLLPPAAQNALHEVLEFRRIVRVLNHFGPGARRDPEWPKLVADIIIARIIANKVSMAITNIQQFAQTVTSDAQKLRDDLVSLKAKAAALEASAAALAALVKQVIRDRLDAVLDRFAALQARFAQVASDIRARFALVEALVSRAKSRLAAAVAAAKHALAKALAQGEQTAQADIVQAQAKAAQTEAKLQHDLAEANFQYARLLCLDEQAVLNQVPGGEAPNVSEQTGWYLYSLPGISGKSHHQTKKSKRQHARSQRHKARKSRRAKIF